MLSALTLTLLFQFTGEVIHRFTGIPIPGPVLGMMLLLGAFFVRRDLFGHVRPFANALLANLAVMFIPAGVGIMRQGERLGSEGFGIVAVIVLSTLIAMFVTAYTIAFTQKLLNIKEDAE